MYIIHEAIVRVLTASTNRFPARNLELLWFNSPFPFWLILTFSETHLCGPASFICCLLIRFHASADSHVFPFLSAAQVWRWRTQERWSETSRERPEHCNNLHSSACRSSRHRLKAQPFISPHLLYREGKWLHGPLVVALKDWLHVFLQYKMIVQQSWIMGVITCGLLKVILSSI